MFASAKTEGQYIHTSSRTYRHVGITLHEDKLDSLNIKKKVNLMFLPTSYEINASASESGYTIKSHYYAGSSEQELIMVTYTNSNYTMYNATVLITVYINLYRVAVLSVYFIVSMNVI